MSKDIIRAAWEVISGLVVVALIAASSIPANGSEGGFSSYVPGLQDSMAGFLPPPGWHVQELIWATSGCMSIEEQEGNVATNARSDVVAGFTVISQVTKSRVLGSYWAWGFLLPMARVDFAGSVTSESESTFIDESVTAPSDLELVPIALGWHNGRSHQKAMLVVYAPTGQYSTGSLATAGLNRWAVELDYAYTFLDEKTLREITITPGYTVNFANPDTDYLSGQELHADFAALQHYKTGLGVGLVGYTVLQTTSDSGAGAYLGSFKSRVFALGPIVLYNAKTDGTQFGVSAKYYAEFGARNRFAGRAFWLNFRLSF